MPTLKRQNLSSLGKGFSLAELLVVIVIVGILASLALASFDWKGQLVISNLENMRSWIESARRSALRGQSCIVTISTSNLKDGSTVLSATPSNSASCGTPASIQLESPYQKEYYLLSLTSGSTAVSTITFTPRGTLYNSSSAPAFQNDLVFNLRIANNAYSPTSKSYCLRMSSVLGSVQGIGSSSC